MTVERDDDLEALSWAGDEGESAVEPTVPPARTVLVESAAAPTTPGILIVTYGIIAGAYILLTAGWIFTVARSTTTLPSLLPEIMFQFGEFLAIASPTLWFATTIALTGHRRPIARLGLLLLGLVVVVPWPFVLGV